ncbi:hypothetical protein ABBQ38_009489 [Trebouxia sp. C0009 RCD-2024]
MHSFEPERFDCNQLPGFVKESTRSAGSVNLQGMPCKFASTSRPAESHGGQSQSDRMITCRKSDRLLRLVS